MSPIVRVLRQRPARIGIAALLLVVAAAYASPVELLSTARNADPAWIAAAAALMPVGLVLQWLKWRALLLPAAPRLSSREVTASLLAGFGLGLLTPGRLGEVGRGVALPGLGRPATGLALADRALSSAVTLLAGGAAAVILWPPTAAATAWVFAGALAAAGLALGARAKRRSSPAGAAGAWSAALRRVPGRTWFACALLSLLFNALFFTQAFLLLRAAGAVAWPAALAIPVAFALKTLLPISFMDLGIREGAAVVALAPFGIAPSVAIHAMLLLFAINVLLPGAAGLLSLGLRRSAAAERVHGR